MPEQETNFSRFAEKLMKLKKKNPRLATKLFWEYVYRTTPGDVVGEGPIYQQRRWYSGSEKRMGEVIEPRLYDPSYHGVIRGIRPNPHRTRDKMIRVRLRKPGALRI
jgi:hypothetical protein